MWSESVNGVRGQQPPIPNRCVVWLVVLFLYLNWPEGEQVERRVATRNRARASKSETLLVIMVYRYYCCDIVCILLLHTAWYIWIVAYSIVVMRHDRLSMMMRQWWLSNALHVTFLYILSNIICKYKIYIIYTNTVVAGLLNCVSENKLTWYSLAFILPKLWY